MFKSWYEDWKKTREWVAQQKEKKPEHAPMFPSAEYSKKVDKFKQQFGYWDEWTGSRFERRQNPCPDASTDLKAVCRSNPATGFWEPI